ncbi:MAG: YitT family protein [Bacteroidales bacterium]|nr:YitT family protein [Bacteroidales bacterium]
MENVLKTSLEAVRTKKFWKDFLVVTLGMMVTAAGIYYFMVPGKLILGTASGIAIVLSVLLESVGIKMKVSLLVLLINLFLLILAFSFLGKDFGVKTVYASLVLGPMMDLWELILPYQSIIEPGTSSVMGDIWLDLLCFIILLSISQAILFNINASTGGLDIVAKLVNKFFHTDIGTALSVSGLIVGLTGFAISPGRLVSIGLIGTWLNGITVDYFMASLNKRQRVCLVSKEHEKIRKFIIESIGRGCSLYEMTGGYTGDKEIEVQSLLTQDEFGNLMEFLRRENIQAFVTAGNVSEIYGLWFKPKKFHF